MMFRFESKSFVLRFFLVFSNVVNSLKRSKLNDSFQEKMKSDILDIKSSQNVLIFADKTSNIYKAAPQEYNTLLQHNRTMLQEIDGPFTKGN